MILKQNPKIALGVHYHRLDSKEAFFQTLNKVLGYLETSDNFRPLLHFECHGGDDGIELANGDCVSWNEMKPLLTEINQESRLNLLIVMAACHGAHLAKALKLTDRALCWGILGPAEEVNPFDLIGSFRDFYTQLFESSSFNSAFDKLKICSDREADYWFVTAKDMFDQTLKMYKEQLCKEKDYWRRAREMLSQAPSKAGKKKLSIQDLVLEIKNYEPQFLQGCKYQFFMCDLFPENTKRFNVDSGIWP